MSLPHREEIADLRSTPVERDPVGIAMRFLTALFEPTDPIVIRPIETWSEAGHKRSRVGYRQMWHGLAEPSGLATRLPQLLAEAAKDRLNLFFGVCPRFAAGRGFDMGWQIRTVRTLWVDIDHVTVDAARERIAHAGLPAPSILVNSGNGVHAYWRLDVPYRIDDVGAPSPVLTEWIEKDGKKTPQHSVIENGDKVVLDAKSIRRVSPKAKSIQDLLAGIAAAVGGDHTHDVARLLRIAGTLNRKDERAGRVPKATELVVCDPACRYPLARFESFVASSTSAGRSRKSTQMPSPQLRPPSASKRDRLETRIAACAMAPVGNRSEVDFALCCYAIENGIAKDTIGPRVASIGKFAEQGRRYFDRTWENAELAVRSDTYAKIASPHPGPASLSNTRRSEAATAVPESDPEEDGAATARVRPRIEITSDTPVADVLGQITHHLMQGGRCYSRADQFVHVRDETMQPILSHAELAGLLNEHAELYFRNAKGGAYRPLPINYANTWLNKPAEYARFPKIALFTRNPVYSEDWRRIAAGYDPASGIYCASPMVVPRTNTQHLDRLMQDFCFRSESDRSNYLGILLTAILMPRFIGCKPAVLFNGNQPGLGKTMLAQMIALLRDGRIAETVSYNHNDEELEKRLGASVRRGDTTIIVDNAKGQGGDPCIASACLERSITDAIVSFRLLGQSQTIRAENSFLFCVTANSPRVSQDLITRSLVVNLVYEGDPAKRRFAVANPEDYLLEHRTEILGELIGMIERWLAAGRPLAQVQTRFERKQWGAIVGGILAANGRRDFLANAKESAGEFDTVRQDFAELANRLADESQTRWTATELVEFCRRHRLFVDELANKTTHSQTTRFGLMAGKFIGERFPHHSGQTVIFQRFKERNGSTFGVTCEAIPPDDTARVERHSPTNHPDSI